MSYRIPPPARNYPASAWGPAFEQLGLAGTLDAPATLRTWITQRLTHCGRPYAHDAELAATLQLVTSELATNAVVHSASGQTGGFLLATVHFPHDRIGLTITDQGPRPAQPLSPQQPPTRLDLTELYTEEGGRGLALVALHTHRYGWTAPPRDPLHTVWCELAPPSTAPINA